MWYKEIRNYGINIILKDYAKFPRYLPLPCHTEHGWNADNKPLNSDLITKKPLMMVFSKRQQRAWEKRSKIPAVIMGVPFILYKDTHHIAQRPDAKGTVAFPCHSTYFLKHGLNIEDYCRELKRLPKEFQPVTVCLFYLDYLDKADIYRKKGFKVVTAGHKITNSLEFVRNFYNILSSHKYSTSDNVGSHTFFAVDLGIPFFLTGECSDLVNKAHRDPNIAERTRLDKFRYGKKAREIFSTGPVRTISKAQTEFVTKEIGAKDHLSQKQMHRLFWRYLKKNHYGIKVYIPYALTTIWAYMFFNGPWIKYLMRIRKWMTDEQRSFVPNIDKLRPIWRQINLSIKQIGIYNFFYYGLHHMYNSLRFPGRLPDYKSIQRYFENKCGFEVGGPSKFFMSNGPLPIYPVVKSLDNINFHKTTVWTNNTTTELFSVKKNSFGRQYIADGTKLAKIKKKDYDFFLSSNVLEHFANPLLSIEQALKILSDNGLLLLIVPRQESNFDHKRSIASFAHLLKDYKNHTKEDDLTHLPEILRLHDMRLDPAARSASDFKRRSIDNASNRCLHHHVFDAAVLKEIFQYFNIDILNLSTVYSEYIILGRKKR